MTEMLRPDLSPEELGLTPFTGTDGMPTVPAPPDVPAVDADTLLALQQSQDFQQAQLDALADLLLTL